MCGKIQFLTKRCCQCGCPFTKEDPGKTVSYGNFVIQDKSLTLWDIPTNQRVVVPLSSFGEEAYIYRNGLNDIGLDYQDKSYSFHLAIEDQRLILDGILGDLNNTFVVEKSGLLGKKSMNMEINKGMLLLYEPEKKKMVFKAPLLGFAKIRHEDLFQENKFVISGVGSFDISEALLNLMMTWHSLHFEAFGKRFVKLLHTGKLSRWLLSTAAGLTGAWFTAGTLKERGFLYSLRPLYFTLAMISLALGILFSIVEGQMSKGKTGKHSASEQSSKPSSVSNGSQSDRGKSSDPQNSE